MAQVSRHMCLCCELAWPHLYRRRYGRDTLAAKQKFRENLFTAGVVVRYNAFSRAKDILLLQDVKKYLHTGHGIAYINVHDECMFRESILHKEVVDIDSVNDTLYILSKNELVAYKINDEPELLYGVPMINGKRILYIGCVETYDGRILQMKNYPYWQDVTSHYSMSLNLHTAEGDVRIERIPRHRILRYFTTAIMDEKLYILPCENVVEGDVIVTIPIKVKYGTFSNKGFVFVTHEGELFDVTWRIGEKRTACDITYHVEDKGLLPNPITNGMDCCVYYIRKSW